MVTDLEEVESPDGGVVQPHVLPQPQRCEAERVEVRLIGEKLEESNHSSQT